MSCAHPGKGFYRKPWSDQSGYHIVEWCPGCGASSVWVARAEVLAQGLDPDSLPLLPEPTVQPGLFDSEGGAP